MHPLLAVPARPAPLTELPNGAIRVTGSRIGLEIVIHQFQSGRTPEQIVEDFDSLALSDVYVLKAFYLDNKDKVEQYLREYEEAAEAMREKIEAFQGPPKVTREMLLERKARMDEARRNVETGR